MFAREEANAERIDNNVRNYQAFHDEFHAYDRPLKKVIVKEEIDNRSRISAIGTTGLLLLAAYKGWGLGATVCSAARSMSHSPMGAFFDVGYYGCTILKGFVGAAAFAIVWASSFSSYQNLINNLLNVRALWNRKAAHKTIHADVNAQHDGSSLLHLSIPVIDSVEVAQVRDQSLADALKSQNIDYTLCVARTVNVLNSDTSINKQSLARALIAHGADLHVKENDITPLDYAVMKGNQKIAAMLICAGAPITDFARHHIQEHGAAFDQWGAETFTQHLDANNTTEEERARARLVGWRKVNMKSMLENPAEAFSHADRNEKRRHIGMVRKRTALVENPSFQESVHVYLRTGFQPMLQKYCRLNRGVYKALNENTVLPQGPVDATFDTLDGTDRLELINRAHACAVARGHTQLAEALVACGAQPQEPEQTAYGSYSDEFNAYNVGKNNTEKMQDFLMDCKNQVPGNI